MTDKVIPLRPVEARQAPEPVAVSLAHMASDAYVQTQFLQLRSELQELRSKLREYEAAHERLRHSLQQIIDDLSK